MIIVGAGGLAKELLEVFYQKSDGKRLCFYDGVSKNKENSLYNEYPILRSEKEVMDYMLGTSNEFTLGIGNPINRFLLYEKFNALGGSLSSAISTRAFIGSYDVIIGTGANILATAVISNSVSIGLASLVYYNVTITHDCIIGDFVEISPGATILGGAKIGAFTQIGANATILPRIEIGTNCIVGAGAVVTKDVPNNCLVVGVPAKVVKELNPIV